MTAGNAGERRQFTEREGRTRQQTLSGGEVPLGHGRVTSAQQSIGAANCTSKARHGHCLACGARVGAVGGHSFCKDCA